MAHKNPWFNASLPHHTSDGFKNMRPGGHKPGDVKRWRRERKAAGLPLPPAGGYEQFTARWWQKAELDPLATEDKIWWLGHSTILLQIQNRFILTDPVLSQRASPLSFAGPLRRTPPALSVDELHSLDAIVISHNHYDHLDDKTIRQLVARFPEVTIFAPLGLGKWLQRRGARQVVERDWWEAETFHGMTFTAVPARHWSMRTFWDRNASLWCGWVIEHCGQRFWFPGDTGYSSDLLQIPQRLGDITLAALPIGAYAPRWFMASNHMDPQQAVHLWRQLGQPRAFPIHWGVFELADESLDEPVNELQNALNETVTGFSNFNILKIGQYLTLQG
ncbi:MBL fold metallo-hydrolase [Yokenella regensburgei]|uniref:MBL fold metallo-hydrolase n=1 Tax=Yokenella regensburgei TaxID=158877 RepID=UPI003F13F4D3